MPWSWRGALDGMARTIQTGPAATQNYYDQVKKEDKAAKALFDALEPAADNGGGQPAHPFGLSRDAFNALSAQDRIGTVTGFLQARALKQQEENANFQNQARYLEMLHTAQQMNNENQQRAATDALMGAPQLYDGATAPDQRIWSALEQNPEARRADPRVVEMLLRQQEQRNATMGFGANDVVDLEKLTGDPRLSGQFQVRQSRGSFQNLNTVPRSQGLPFEQRLQLLDRGSLLSERRQLVKEMTDPLNRVEAVQSDLKAQLDAIDARLGGARSAGGTATGTNNAPPYPDGTRLRGRDGKSYVVQNGQPVLVP